MPAFIRFCLTIQGLLLFVLSNTAASLCQFPCPCTTKDNEYNSSIICGAKLYLSRNNGTELCENSFNTSFNVNGTSQLIIQCPDVRLQRNVFRKFFNLTRLSIVQSNLRSLHFDLRGQLKFLNLSYNSLSDINFSAFDDLSSLELLDLSQNTISELNFDQTVSFNLRSLFLQRNNIIDLSGVKKLTFLEVLDASFNPVSLERSNLYEVFQLKKLVLQSVNTVTELNAISCGSNSQCRKFPSNLEVLDLGYNRLSQVPSCNGLLFGLLNLQVLLLEHNQISMVFERSFQGDCFASLKVLSLHDNRLIRVDSSFLSHLSLQSLILSRNYLQHISLLVLQHFTNTSEGQQSWHGCQYQNGVNLTGNLWACDCFQKDVHDWLISQNSSVSLQCEIPDNFKGQELKSLSRSELTCIHATIVMSKNATKVQEYSDGVLICKSEGVPKPMVQWYTPQDVLISVDTISEHQPYGLSIFGEELIVKDVRLSKTGLYRCTANNSVGIASDGVTLSVVLSSLSTIIFLIVACVAFVVAIILNSVNMCMYVYEHVQAKRKYKKAIQEQKREETLNPPIQQRARATVDESMASLNADRHYGKYDFTCQQMFLDTMIKGAYSVKKTLYDARHSEFSSNMLGYAASIKDRLHIDLPSQLPTISMPSISMPTISMPSIPTMHDINTNIEKLGSSMMTRSHNLATSVGSVFTLKRWMWQQQQQDSNASDNESKGSDEIFEKDELKTSVNVDVHRPSEGLIEPDDVPCSSKHDARREGPPLEFTRLLSNRSGGEIIAANSSKSLPNYPRRCPPDHPELEIQSRNKNVSFVPEQITKQPASEVQNTHGTLVQTPSVITISHELDKSCHSYETSV